MVGREEVGSVRREKNMLLEVLKDKGREGGQEAENGRKNNDRFTWLLKPGDRDAVLGMALSEVRATWGGCNRPEEV